MKSPNSFPWDTFNDMTMAQRVQLLAERSEEHETRHGDLTMVVQTFVGGFERAAKSIEKLVERQEDAAARALAEKQAEHEDRARWGRRTVSVLAAVGVILAALLLTEYANHGEWSTRSTVSSVLGGIILAAVLTCVWVMA